MLSAKRVPREEVLEHAAEGYRRRYPDGPPRVGRPANAGAVLLLVGGDVLEMTYRGRLYEIGFPSFEDGVRLTLASHALEALEEDATPERYLAYLEALRLVASMAPKYLKPAVPSPELPLRHRTGLRLRRLCWILRLRLNPFRNATEAEVGLLLGFFLRSRTRSRVGSPGSSEARRRQTSSTSGRSIVSLTAPRRRAGKISSTASPI